MTKALRKLPKRPLRVERIDDVFLSEDGRVRLTIHSTDGRLKLSLPADASHSISGAIARVTRARRGAAATAPRRYRLEAPSHV